MIQLDHTLLAVNGQELASHVLVLVSQDHLDLVTSTGNNRSQVLRSNVDNSEEGEEKLKIVVD